VAQHAGLVEDDQEERAYRINQVLEEDSHFNFPKLHLLSHYALNTGVCHSIQQYVRHYTSHRGTPTVEVITLTAFLG